MAEKTINALQIFDNGTNLNYIEKDGEVLFTTEEIGKHLGYSDPIRAVSKLYKRNQNELKLYTSVVKLTTGNQFNEIRTFTEEGVYIISMLARTNEAKKFRARVALLLRRLRKEVMQRELEQAKQMALEQGIAQGIALRQRVTPQRRAEMNRALKYRRMGLELRDIGKLMDCSHQKIFYLLKDAKLMGMGV